MTSTFVANLVHAIDAAILLQQIRTSVVHSLEMYDDSVNNAIGFILEVIAGFSWESVQPDEGFYDFGPEPFSKNEAIAAAEPFLEQCSSLLRVRQDKPSCGCPFSSIAVRAETLKVFLLTSDKSA